jgi:HEXXH motif-containing protein
VQRDAAVAVSPVEMLFTPDVDPSAQRAWRTALATRMFAVTTLLRRHDPGLPWRAVDTLWSSPADARASQLQEPLLSYGHHLLTIAAAAPAASRRKQASRALQLIGVVLVGNALSRGAGAIGASATVRADRFGRIRFPNWGGVIDVGSVNAGCDVDVSVEAGGAVVTRAGGAARVPHRVVKTRHGPRKLAGGLLVSWDEAYRQIGRTTIDRNRRIAEERARAAERAAVLDGGPFPVGADVVRRLDEAARAMVDTVPDWFEASRAFAPVLVPIATPYAVGFSVDKCRGAVFIAPEEHRLDTVDHYVHEAAHNRLDTAMELWPLFDRSDSRLFVSPWRLDPRPMAGLVHGIYSFGVAAHVLARLSAGDDDRMGAGTVGMAVTTYCEDVERAIETVAASGIGLTSDGERFLDRAARFVRGARAIGS